MSLTDLSLKRLSITPGQPQREFADGTVAGLYVRVGESTKAFRLHYRLRGDVSNKRYKMTLGVYPTLSLKQARDIAKQHLTLAAQGINPDKKSDVEDIAKHAYFTVVERFDALHCMEVNKPRMRQGTLRYLKTTFGDAWGDHDVRTITPKMIISVLDKIAADGKIDKAPLAAIRKFFNWCASKQIVSVSPCFGIKANRSGQIRDRVLTPQELVKIWNACEVIGYPFGPLVRLTLLTAQRRSEVGGMHWTELEGDLWVIPYVRTKKPKKTQRPRVPHYLPLSRMAMEIISGVPKLHADFVFPANGSKDAANPISGWNSLKRRLDAASGVTDWTLHDMRRTAATILPDLDVDNEVVSKILNHAPQGVTATVYNKNLYLDQKRRALNAWGDYIEKLVAGGVDAASSTDRYRRSDGANAHV